MERHHPAGRRKDAFLFTVMLHPQCHDKVHADPANAKGLLWKGRNSKKLTIEDANIIINSWPHPQQYPLKILKESQ
jgi:hypothetical protein